jgi:hypothetical protein
MSKELKEHLQLFSIETIGKRYIEELGLRSGTMPQNAPAQTAVRVTHQEPTLSIPNYP